MEEGLGRFIEIKGVWNGSGEAGRRQSKQGFVSLDYEFYFKCNSLSIQQALIECPVYAGHCSSSGHVAVTLKVTFEGYILAEKTGSKQNK